MLPHPRSIMRLISPGQKTGEDWYGTRKEKDKSLLTFKGNYTTILYIGANIRSYFGKEKEIMASEDKKKALDAAIAKLEKDFDVSFKSVEGLEGNIRYQALTSGKIDVIDAFETDALLLSMDLVKLEDDIGFFPPYQAVAVTRNETFEKYPELEEVFAKLEGAISTDEMMEMNYQVDVEGRTPKDVAVDFLEAEGLI